MAHYDLIRDFGYDPGETDTLSVDPHWVIAVIRFANPITYSREAKGSFSTLYDEAVRTRGNTLIIADSCIQLTTTSTKSSHMSSMSATLLLDPDHNYLAEVLPGDWVFCWMMQSKEDQLRVIEAIRASDQANDWADGFKFMGRVQSMRKQVSRGSNGEANTHYSLGAAGFTEFDSTLYYEPALAAKVPSLGLAWSQISANINKLIAENQRGIDSCKALVFFLDLFLGQGVPVNLGRGNVDPRLHSTAGLAAPFSYIIPTVVGQLLGKNEKTKDGGLLSYTDILEFVYGIQNYSGSGMDPQNIFNPYNTQGPGSRRWTGTDLLGTFLPYAPPFNDKSVWSMLSQYLNGAVNEMFTCLRVNPDGKVVPTLIARQLPLSTDDAPAGIAVTKFLDLPRWRLDPILLRRFDVGRSDALRFNFFHVYGDPGPVVGSGQAGQVTRDPPLRDDLDIARSGLRPLMQTISCADTDIRDRGAEVWMGLLSDMVSGQQLTLTGTIELVGIRAPICPGDNVEFDDTVFHIESVTHTCGISQSGMKMFTTSLALTHGVAKEPSPGLVGIYSGLTDDSLRTYEGGASRDGQDPNVDASSPAGSVPGTDPTGVLS